MYWLNVENRESIIEYRMRMKRQEDYEERLERIEKQKQEKMIAVERWKVFDEVSDLNDDMKQEIRKFLY